MCMRIFGLTPANSSCLPIDVTRIPTPPITSPVL